MTRPQPSAHLPQPESSDNDVNVEPLGGFELFGMTFTAWRDLDLPTTIRFASDGTEIGKLVDIGSYPRLRLHRVEWAPYRRNTMRFKLLDLLAAKNRSP